MDTEEEQHTNHRENIFYKIIGKKIQNLEKEMPSKYMKITDHQLDFTESETSHNLTCYI